MQAITLIGMSGVGKTHIATALAEAGFYHYSTDYHIAAHLAPDINTALTARMTDSIKGEGDTLAALLAAGTVRVEGTVHTHNLDAVADYIGKLGDPAYGGMDYARFLEHQRQYFQTECAITETIPSVVAEHAARGQPLVHDSTGSFCQLPEAIIAKVRACSKMVYIQASFDDEARLLAEAIRAPKPLCYPGSFLGDSLAEFLNMQGLTYSAQMRPDDFYRFIFPRLVAYRKPLYERYADAVIASAELASLKGTALIHRIQAAFI